MAVLETPRLTLRTMTLADTDNLLGIFSDPIAMAYYPSTKDRAETVEWIERIERSYAADGIGLWIVEDKATGQFLGQCGLMMQTVDGVRQPEVGYLFLRSVWGNGYAAEAAAACLDYGFTQCQFRQIIALIAPDNQQSRRVAERCGMHLDRQTTWRDQTITVYAKEREQEG